MSAEASGQDGGTGPGEAATLRTMLNPPLPLTKVPPLVITSDWQVTVESANRMLSADRDRQYRSAMLELNKELNRRLRDGQPLGQVRDWYAAMVEHLNIKYRMS